MCRFTVYKGRPLLLGDILIKPDNSLLVQARDAQYHPGVEDCTHRRNIIVNGDGFGLAWYVDEPEKGACCCKFLTPAWSNPNLRNLGEYVKSPLIIGHVRAASSGHNPLEDVAISTENCHPFKYGRWTFVHNGGIPQFKRVKRALVMLLKDECFHDICGSTDSECVFALFLSLLPNRDIEVSMEVFIATVNCLISTILELCESSGITEPCSLNVCITDGTNLISTRYRNGPEQPPSLYFKYGSNFKCVDGNLFCSDESPPSELIIASAPLSKVSPGRHGYDSPCSRSSFEGHISSSVIYSQYKSSWLTRVSSHDNLIGPSSPERPHMMQRAVETLSRDFKCVFKGSKIDEDFSSENQIDDIPDDETVSTDAYDETKDTHHYFRYPSMSCTSENHLPPTWTLIPKDHMLISVGDPNDISKVVSVHVQPIEAAVGKGLVHAMRLARKKEILKCCFSNTSHCVPENIGRIDTQSADSILEDAISKIDIKILTGMSPCSHRYSYDDMKDHYVTESK